jgi:CubicO group peptidase (beta-lactamase class C family)
VVVTGGKRFHMIKKMLSLHLVFSLIFFSSFAQNPTSLPRSIPETEGVSSEGILQFILAVEQSKNEMHSFIFLRHGKVIAEGWWNPYKPDLKHALYSLSKTFTSTAIGFAVSENLLKLTDKVISFFPNDLPDTVSPYLAGLTIRDVLIMSDGQDPDPTRIIGTQSKNWVRAFLKTPIVKKPGTAFLYNSMGTFMLSAIIQKVTGQRVINYLKPRLFDPLGIVGMDWEENLLGVNTGGWGLRLKTEDIAKMGLLYLQKGMWNGTQIIPAAWIEEATTLKIIQHPELIQAKKDSSDWEQGYGYQIWRCRYQAYRGDGAFGQYMIVMPEQDAVIAIQSETPDMQDELNLVWKYLLPSIKKGKLSSDQKSQYALKAKLSSLAIPIESGSYSSFTTNKNLNKTFILEPNDFQIGSVVIQIKDSSCHLVLNTPTDVYNLYFNAGSWKSAQTNKPGPSSLGAAKENFAILSPYKVDGNFYWKDDQTLVLVLRYVESPHTQTTTFHFEPQKTSIDIENSFNYGKDKTVLNGVLK